MSLNRSEQLLHDYVQSHPEERQHWLKKVQGLAKTIADPHLAAVRLELELWRYFEERSRVVPAFREIAQREGVFRTSMQNLAEYLLRMWAVQPARPAKPGN
jgi:hypothetical protein